MSLWNSKASRRVGEGGRGAVEERLFNPPDNISFLQSLGEEIKH